MGWRSVQPCWMAKACKVLFLLLSQGKSGISQIEKFDTNGYSTRFAGEIKQLDVTKYVNRKMARRLDDVIKYTIVAGKKVCTAVFADHTHTVMLPATGLSICRTVQ